MQTKGQQQFDMGSFSQEPGTDLARASRYGQQSLPGLSQPKRAPTSDSATRTEGPQQLPMFMSQREIMGKFQPLDADRQEAWDPREGEVTGRQFTTIGNENPKIRTSDRAAPFLQRQGSAVAGATHYRDFGQTESLGMMMDRKLEESQMSYGEYAEAHGGGMGTAKTPGYETAMDMTGAPQYQGTGHTGTHEYEMDQFHSQKVDEHYEKMNYGSLYEDLKHDMTPKEQGGSGAGFTGLVHLSHQFGSAGKPQIAGAHHRLAALGEIAPDRLLPVVHHETMTESRWGPSAKHFKYT